MPPAIENAGTVMPSELRSVRPPAAKASSTMVATIIARRMTRRALRRQNPRRQREKQRRDADRVYNADDSSERSEKEGHTLRVAPPTRRITVPHQPGTQIGVAAQRTAGVQSLARTESGKPASTQRCLALVTAVYRRLRCNKIACRWNHRNDDAREFAPLSLVH